MYQCNEPIEPNAKTIILTIQTNTLTKFVFNKVNVAI
jgi:hypothetical protein